MGEMLSRRHMAIALVLSFILTALAPGCNLLNPQAPQTRPSPTRPSPTGRRTRTPLRPAPTKRLPGLTAADTNTLRQAESRCRTAVNGNDWAAATREANSLGGVWTRFKPRKTGTMSATEMASFDANYAKLQKDVRARNKSGCIRDLNALRDAIAKMR